MIKSTPLSFRLSIDFDIDIAKLKLSLSRLRGLLLTDCQRRALASLL